LQGRQLSKLTARSVEEDGTTPDPKPRTLNGLLSESIDQVLEDLLGRKAKEAVYDYLERNCSLARDDIPQNTEKFFNLTEETFGKGSITIARCITERLWEKLGWRFEDVHGFEFSDYLNMARARVGRELVEKVKASMLTTNEND